jgi:hypothetical protein
MPVLDQLVADNLQLIVIDKLELERRQVGDRRQRQRDDQQRARGNRPPCAAT